MPLFYIISGFLLHLPERNGIVLWIKNKIKRLLVPCCSFFLLNSILTGNVGIKRLLYFLYGGRMIEGVYWFATVLFLANVVFVVVEQKIRRKKIKCLLYSAGYFLCVIESTLWVPNEIAGYPMWLRFPWNIDVVPMAVAFMAAGYHLKKHIQSIAIDGNVKLCKIVLFTSLVTVLVTVVLYISGVYEFTIDMRYSMYKNIILCMIIPLAFMAVLTYISGCLSKFEHVGHILGLVGKQSMIVMYVHLYIRDRLIIPIWGEDYSNVVFVLVTLLLSCLFWYVASKNRILQLLFCGTEKRTV